MKTQITWKGKRQVSMGTHPRRSVPSRGNEAWDAAVGLLRIASSSTGRFDGHTATPLGTIGLSLELNLLGVDRNSLVLFSYSNKETGKLWVSARGPGHEELGLKQGSGRVGRWRVLLLRLAGRAVSIPRVTTQLLYKRRLSLKTPSEIICILTAHTQLSETCWRDSF